MKISIIWLSIWFWAAFTSASYSQGSGKIVFESWRDGSSEIYIMNADGSNQTNITQHPGGNWHPNILPNGQEIVFVSGRNNGNDLYTINIDGSNLRLILSAFEPLVEEPAWSPDGKQIVFSRAPGIDDTQDIRTGGWDIYSIAIGETNITRLTDNTHHEKQPSWSPNGQHILFTSTRDNRGLYRMDRDGSDVTRLADGLGTSRMTYSPDGSRIVFSNWFDNHHENIAIMNADGSDLRILIDHPANDVHPIWSPDGQHIVFASDRDGDFEIYALDIERYDLVQLTDNQSYDSRPSWIIGDIPTAITNRSWGETKRLNHLHK